MAFLRLKWIILVGLLSVLFLFLLNTFILYSDQEEYLKTESKEIEGRNIQRKNEDDLKETEAWETGDDKNRPEMKRGDESEANGKLPLPARQLKQPTTQSVSPEESCKDRHVPKNINNAVKGGKSESLVKPDHNKDVGSRDREHVTQVPTTQDPQVGNIKMSRRLEREKRREKEKEEREKNKKYGYEQHAFNQTASDRISLDRSIPDTRDPRWVLSQWRAIDWIVC